MEHILLKLFPYQRVEKQGNALVRHSTPAGNAVKETHGERNSDDVEPLTEFLNLRRPLH